MDSLEDYKRVHFEEYASAAFFSLSTIALSYVAFDGMIHKQNTIPALLCSYFAFFCGSLAESSFEQGRKMSKVVSRLEKELCIIP